LKAIPDTWNLTADVIVVGGGNAGLPAAIEAHNSGSSVVLLEGNDFLGGLMRGSGGFMYFCATHVQRRLGIEDHVEWGVEDEMLLSDFRAVPELVRTYVEAGAETCLWLERQGLTWADEITDGDWGIGMLGNRRVFRNHFAGKSESGYYPGGSPLGQNGYALTVVLEKAVRNLGLDVLFKHRMRRLYREDGGPVVGVQADTPAGSVDIRARKAVILTSGGATSNEQLVAAWDPRLVNDAIYSDGLPYMTAMGDGIVAGQDVGAGLSDMSFVCFTPVRYGTHYYSLSLTAIEGVPGIGRVTGVPIRAKRGDYQRIILVKNDGRRFVDESEAAYVNPKLPRDAVGVPPAEYPEEPFMRRFLSLPNPKNVWAVTDADGAAAMNWSLDEMADPQPMRGRGLHPDSVAVAETVEELGRRTRVDSRALLSTVRRYNQFAAEGVDEEFGKAPPLWEIARAPFYAAKLNVIRHTPSGGLRVNTKGQVLDRTELWDGLRAKDIDHEAVIPHLYAAGECAAFVGFRRAHRKTGPILTMGRIAGRSAGAEDAC
jgi:succinate dehydrogenase/fumarate reductase flavoprotein subunit